MESSIEYVKTALDAKMNATSKGFPFWYGRDVMTILAYETWENFKKIVEKAIAACNNSGEFSNNHFLEIKEMVDIANGAGRGSRRHGGVRGTVGAECAEGTGAGRCVHGRALNGSAR